METVIKEAEAVIAMSDSLREKVRKHQHNARVWGKGTPTVRMTINALWHIGWITDDEWLAWDASHA